jgi:hypothetical protein
MQIKGHTETSQLSVADKARCAYPAIFWASYARFTGDWNALPVQ